MSSQITAISKRGAHTRNASHPPARIKELKLFGNLSASSEHSRYNSRDKKLPLHYVAKLDRELADEELDAKTQNEEESLFASERQFDYTATNFTNTRRIVTLSE